MIDYERLYRFRFRDVDQVARQAVWNVIANDIAARMANPTSVLDPAGGRGEFIRAIQAPERWMIDRVDPELEVGEDVKVIVSDVMDAELPEAHFDGVFVSNFLEHLPDPNAVARFLCQMNQTMKPSGRIAVMGPNFKYCAREYFDCADHSLILTHVSVEEHLYAAGFSVRTVIPRYLPWSFRSRLPAWPALTSAYLRIGLAQRLLGKQFLVIGVKEDA